jgi:hypothetical protein
MSEASRRLAEIAEQLKRGEQPEPETVRTLLGWFDTQRRGYAINQIIEKALQQFGLTTQPNFRFAYIDSPVAFVKEVERATAKLEETVAPEEPAESPAEIVCDWKWGNSRPDLSPLVGFPPPTSGSSA